MKKFTFLLVVMAAVLAFSSCNKSETYADQLERENNAINAFIVKKGINVISEGQFASQGNTTDVTKNQYVHFSNTGVYMQIVEKGTGEPVRKGETATVLCRFTEWNLIRDTLQLSNQFLVFGPKVDKMSVTHTSGTYTASFDQAGQAVFCNLSAGAREAHCPFAAGTDQCLTGCLSLFLRPYVPEGTLMER